MVQMIGSFPSFNEEEKGKWMDAGGGHPYRKRQGVIEPNLKCENNVAIVIDSSPVTTICTALWLYLTDELK